MANAVAALGDKNKENTKTSKDKVFWGYRNLKHAAMKWNQMPMQITTNVKHNSLETFFYIGSLTKDSSKIMSLQTSTSL